MQFSVHTLYFIVFCILTFVEPDTTMGFLSVY